MADIFLDPEQRIVGARMSTLEYAIVSAAIEAHGSDGLAQMFALFIQQNRQIQVETERKAIHAFAEKADDAQRAELMAVINRGG